MTQSAAIQTRGSTGRRLLLPATVAIALLAAFTCKAAGREPINVVVLSPSQPAGPEDARAVDLFRSQLAAELGKDAELRVVDRSHIDRVLAERAIGAIDRPALAYDVMIRVEIDRLQARPAVVLSVVDLSNGNLAGARQWPWAPEMPDAVLRGMVGVCKQLAIDAVATSRGRLKVRSLGVTTPDGMGRLEPMRSHLQEMLDSVLAANPTLCIVHHLEALTAAEESLLLLAGHVRMAGGRQYVPEADRVFKAQLTEVESAGKAFETTIIELRFRLDAGDSPDGWTAVRGKVADWPELAVRLCSLLAAQLGRARPEEAADMVAEMITRRRQAEAELEAASQHKGKDGRSVPGHIAAAAKLDPSYEPAAYRLVGLQHTYKERLREALAYLERFPEDPKHRQQVIHDVFLATRKELCHEPPPEELEKARRRARVTMMGLSLRPLHPDETDMLRRIVEIGLDVDVRHFEPYCGCLVNAVHQGMMDCGIAGAYRWQWLDRVRRRVDGLMEHIGEVDAFHRPPIGSGLLRVRALLVLFAMEEGDAARVKIHLEEFKLCGRWVARDSWGIAQHLRNMLAQHGDDELLEGYDRWLSKWNTPVRRLDLIWDDFPIYEEAVIEPKMDRCIAMVPLAACPRILYGVAGTNMHEITGWSGTMPSRQRLCRIPIDSEGRPAWGTLPDVATPCPEDMAVTSGTCLDGRLYVGTKRTGLLIIETGSGASETVGLAQGLPDVNVRYVTCLDGERLLIVTGEKERTTYCTLEAKTGRITLIHRLDGKSPLYRTPSHVWWNGEKLMAFGFAGLAQDILRTPPEFANWPDVWPYGWKRQRYSGPSEPTSMAVVNGNRYVMACMGLHEIDHAGGVRRSWWNRTQFSAACPGPDGLSQSRITTPSGLPDDNPRTSYKYVAGAGSHLFLVGEQADTADLLCYEPATDTWFGPLRLKHMGEHPYPMGDAQGVWVGGTDGLAYMATSDFLEAARAAGRVMTTPAVAQRKRELAEAAGPFADAKFRLLLRDFAGARHQTESILAASPDDAKSLLLMAKLHESWCLDQPDESLRWYRRLSALEADPSAIYTGLYGEFRINYTLKRWDAAIAAGDRLLEDIPHLYGGMTTTVERFLEYARKRKEESARK